MKLLLDTTVLVDALRGVQATLERLGALEQRPLISVITVEEILFGMRDSERVGTEELLAWPVTVEIGTEEARIGAHWRKMFAAEGLNLQQSDTLIAASALTNGAGVATANVRHFPMPELEVQAWPSA